MDLAHGIGSGADLPISVGAAALGGALAVAISFAVLAVAWRRPRLSHVGGRPLPVLTSLVDGRAVRTGLRLLGLVLFGFVVWSAAVGPDDPGVNPGFGLVFVLLWVGLVPASLLAGPVIKAISPVRTIHLVVSRIIGRPTTDGVVAVPPWVGYWPAAGTLLAFTWLELVSPNSTDLTGLRALLMAYVVVTVLGACVFGEVWLERADPFEVYSSLTARMSPWSRDESNRVVLTNPLRNLAALPVGSGLVAVVAVLLGSTAFDSFAGSTRWLRFTQATDFDVTLLESGLLLGTILTVAVVFVAATAPPTRWAGGVPAAAPARYAHSLLPIVLGYVVAHYLTLFVETGQSTLIQMSDPLGRGWDLFGTADRQVDLWLSLHPTFLASTKVTAIVLGHLLAAIAAHDRALTDLPQQRRISAQVPLLAVMVAYTFGGLTLLLGG